MYCRPVELLHLCLTRPHLYRRPFDFVSNVGKSFAGERETKQDKEQKVHGQVIPPSLSLPPSLLSQLYLDGFGRW